MSKKLDVPSSRVLLPMACAALIGANLTLIGASHNLVVHGLLEQAEGRGFGFFEFTLVGLALLAVALVYILVLGPRLLPGARQAPDPLDVPETHCLVDVYRLRDRFYEIYASGLSADGPRTVGDLALGDPQRITVLALVRRGDELHHPRPDLALEEGDMLLVQAREEDAEAFARGHPGLTFLGAPTSQQRYPLSTAELAEAVVPPRSPAVGKSVRELELPAREGMTAIAIYRDGEPRRIEAMDTVLAEGDSVLFWGPRDRMREFDPEKTLLIYFKPGTPEVSSRLKRYRLPAAGILAAVIAVAALDLYPIAVTALAGAAAMIALGIVRPAAAYRAVDWRTLVLIGGMFPLGVALQDSGAADLVGEGLVSTLGTFGPRAVMAGIVVVTMVLTQPIHNAAVAIIMTPVAIQVARLMDSDPRAFCVAVLVACSTAFLMPYGHPAPLMVQEPGGYRAGDYLRFGLGLEVLALAVILVVVPLLWPL